MIFKVVGLNDTTVSGTADREDHRPEGFKVRRSGRWSGR